MTRRSNRAAWGLAAAVSLLLVLGAVPVLFLWSFRSVVKIRPDPPFDWKRAQKVIAAIAHGELKADAYGQVMLPTQYASSSFANRVYTIRKRKGLTLMLFPASESWDGYVDGYLYASRTLVQADRAGRDSSSGHETVRLPYGKHQPRIVAALVRQLNAHWYKVHHDEFTRLR